MPVLRVICTFMLVALVMSTPVRAQDDDEGFLALSALVGLQNQPGGFDVFRTVDYAPGKLVGGGLTIGLFPGVSIRADVSLALSSGQQTGVIAESVKLNRSYYGASLELRLPRESGLSPYIFGGGGFIKLRRSAPSYNFDLTESGALLGGGIAWRFRESPVSAFVQVMEWIYPRTSAGGTQYDTSFGAGLSYRIPI
jgi:hypothetical protein